jgi:hypothetical protein
VIIFIIAQTAALAAARPFIPSVPACTAASEELSYFPSVDLNDILRVDTEFSEVHRSIVCQRIKL